MIGPGDSNINLYYHTSYIYIYQQICAGYNNIHYSVRAVTTTSTSVEQFSI